jgi:hypothetical protein
MLYLSDPIRMAHRSRAEIRMQILSGDHGPEPAGEGILSS